LEARYPPEFAEDMVRRYMTRSFHFSPAEHEFNVKQHNQDNDEDPNVGFDAASIGATTPKGQTANPRELGPLSGPREGQGEDRIVRPFQMQTSFDDPKNVMSSAWGLLKGNPSMRDAEGRAINHPAAMVYDDLAAQIHLNEQDPFDERHGNPDDKSAADVMEEMRKPTHQRKVMRRLKQGKPASFLDAKMAMRDDKAEQDRLNRYRQEAREQTRNTMEFGNEDNSPSPNYGIMQTSFDDPKNVMSSAWGLLKGNPDMTDMSGHSVPPAAMNYAQQGRALEDSLEYNNYMATGRNERRGVAAPDMFADENTSRFADKLKKPRFARKKVGGETMQEHHDFARERSKRDTADYMDEAEGHNQFGADVNIQRMPRPAP
jgi:hypothetical protein